MSEYKAEEKVRGGWMSIAVGENGLCIADSRKTRIARSITLGMCSLLITVY